MALLLRRDGDLGYSAIGLGATIGVSRDAYPPCFQLISAVSWADALVEVAALFVNVVFFLDWTPMPIVVGRQFDGLGRNGGCQKRKCCDKCGGDILHCHSQATEGGPRRLSI